MTDRSLAHHRAGLSYRAVGMWEAGMSRVAVSNSLRVPRSTVGFWVQKFQRFGSLDRLTVEGRPRVTSRRADRRLKRLCRRGRFMTSTELLQSWDEDVSPQTVRNRLHHFGLRSRRPAVCPLLSPCHRSARLAWAMARCHFREAQWSRIIFTDESRFLLRPKDGRIRVWRYRGERFDEECTVQEVAHGGGSIHVWGAICRTGRSQLHILRSNVNAVTYKQVLEQQLRPWAEDHLGPANTWWLQDDNAPPHRASSVNEFKAATGIRSIPWPSRSPDLNPIEHVWDMLGRRVRSPQPKSLVDLAARLKAAWDEIPLEQVTNLIDSMPRRIRAVIEAHGGQTRY